MRAIDYFDKGAEIDPNRTAVLGGGTAYSYRELSDLTHKVARAMWAKGLKPEEPVAIYAPNDVSVLVCLLGLWRAGAAWIPVNARNAMDANVQYMNYVRTKWLFYHTEFRDDALKLIEQVPSIRHVVCLDAQDSDYPSFESFMQQGEGTADIDWADPFGNIDHTVGIFATGGTTGPSKGVVVKNLGWGTLMGLAIGYWRADDVKPVCLATAPLTHAAGVVASAAFGMGATNVIMPGFDALGVLENIERHKVTHIYLPPTALYMLLDHPKIGDFDYSSLRMFLLVSSPVAPDKLKRAVEVFGPCMCQCFGQVEAPMILTWLPQKDVAAAAAGDHPERLASCGKPSSVVRLAIMDDDGNILPPGERGEIVARGNLISHGYFEMPEATQEVRTFNWHHTGDVGYQDEDGYVYIVDRKKDMIVTGGFNVFSVEVEACVMELPQVRDCSVIGTPHEKWGEAVTAVVALADNAEISEQEIIDHCKQRLGGVKAPKAVHIWPELPKTPNGKPDKKSVRQRFWKDTARSVN